MSVMFISDSLTGSWLEGSATLRVLPMIINHKQKLYIQAGQMKSTLSSKHQDVFVSVQNTLAYSPFTVVKMCVSGRSCCTMSIRLTSQRLRRHLTGTVKHTGFNGCLLVLYQVLQRGFFSHRPLCLPRNSLSLMTEQYDTAVRYLII